MRRIAWKQCRSCSADSDSMWADSLARCAARGMDALALGLEHAGHRVLGEPVDLQVGHERAQLARDRDVAARVAEADRRGDVQRARAGRRSGGPSGRAGSDGSTNSRIGEVDLDRADGTSGTWSPPSIVVQRPPVHGLGERLASA